MLRTGVRLDELSSRPEIVGIISHGRVPYTNTKCVYNVYSEAKRAVLEV